MRRVALLLALAAMPLIAPASAPALVNTGELRVLVILVTWGPEPFPRTQAQAAVFSGSDAFVRENSFVAAWLSGEVTPWLRAFVAPPPCGTPAEQRSLAAAAQSAARSAGFAVDSYSRFIYAFPTALNCGYLGYGGLREVWLNGAITARLVSHELGHTFGLEHAHLHDCSRSSCVEVEYGDPFDTMGSGSSHYNAYEKWFAGWLKNVSRAGKSGDYTIDQLERSSSLAQALHVQTAHADYWLDHREPIGADAPLASLPIVLGVEIHAGPPAADPTAASEFSSANSLLPNPGGRGIPVLLPGDSLSVRNAFRVTVVAHEGTSMRVRFAWADRIRPTRPALSVPKRGRRNRPARVEWEPATDDGSGVARYDISLNGRVVARVTADFKLPTNAALRPTKRGVNVVRVVAVDRAGNRSKPATATIRAA